MQTQSYGNCRHLQSLQTSERTLREIYELTKPWLVLAFAAIRLTSNTLVFRIAWRFAFFSRFGNSGRSRWVSLLAGSRLAPGLAYCCSAAPLPCERSTSSARAVFISPVRRQRAPGQAADSRSHRVTRGSAWSVALVVLFCVAFLPGCSRVPSTPSHSTRTYSLLP